MLIPDLGSLLISSSDALAVLIKLIFTLMAVTGLVFVTFGLHGAYKIVEEGSPNSRMGGGNSSTPGNVIGKFMLGGLMVVPSVTLWTAADTFIVGGAQTRTDLLSYLGGTYGATYCDQFASAIQLVFMVVGCIALFMSAMVTNDAVSGSRQSGAYRSALVYFFGGLLCFFINDLADILGNTFGFTMGLHNVCGLIVGPTPPTP